jgi:hypothetical protein
MLACFYANIVAIPTPITAAEPDEKMLEKIKPNGCRDGYDVCIKTCQHAADISQTLRKYKERSFLRPETELFTFENEGEHPHVLTGTTLLLQVQTLGNFLILPASFHKRKDRDIKV